MHELLGEPVVQLLTVAKPASGPEEEQPADRVVIVAGEYLKRPHWSGFVALERVDDDGHLADELQVVGLRVPPPVDDVHQIDALELALDVVALGA